MLHRGHVGLTPFPGTAMLGFAVGSLSVVEPKRDSRFAGETRLKGVVFNLLEELIRREKGEEAWDDLLRTANVDGAYTSLGSYADSELVRLVHAAAAATGLAASEMLRWFGQHSIPLLAARYPQFFDTQSSTRGFLLTLNDIIHPEVRKLYPGADVPVFDFDTSSTDVLVVGYRSPRKMCALAQGFTEGAADHFQEAVSFEHPACMLRGDPKCIFHLRFSAKAA